MAPQFSLHSGKPFAVALLAALIAVEIGLAKDLYIFQAPGRLELPGAANAMGAWPADFDGNGLPDVVASVDGSPPTLRTFLADAPLTFHTGSRVEVPFAGAVRIAELTGDGIPDALILRKSMESSVAVLSGKGGGEFGLLSVALVGSNERFYQVLVDDIDGDGAKDIFLVGRDPCILYGPRFDAPQMIYLGQEESTGALAIDPNGDGRKDLLVSNIGAFQLLLQEDTRSFATEAVQGWGVGPLFQVDVDGDGIQEIVGRRGNGIGAFTIDGEGGEWKTSFTPLWDPGVSFIWDFSLVDMDMDGAEDLFVIVDPGKVQVVFGERKDGALSLDGPMIVTDLPAFCDREISVVADIDGNDWRDVLLGTGYFLIDGPGSIKTSRWVAGGHAGWTVGASSDLDGDGYDDLVRVFEGRLEMFRGMAEGFSAPTVVRPGFVWDPTVLAAGMLRMDGPGSILAEIQAQTYLIEFDGIGEPGPAIPIPLSGLSPWGTAIVRWGEDARLLTIVTSPDSPNLLTLYDLAKPRDPVTVLRFFVSSQAANPRISDLDGDGWNDIAWMSDTGAHVAWGSPSGPKAYTEAAKLPWEFPNGIAALDVDGDGIDEVTISTDKEYGTPPGIILLRRRPDGSWSSKTLSPDPISAMVPADLDGDGKMDLVAAGQLQVLRNDGKELSAPEAIGLGGDSPGALAVADLDGDGYLDLATGGNSLVVVYGKPMGQFDTSVDLFPLGTGGPTGIQAVDLNHDDLIDFVVDYEYMKDSLILGKPGGTFGKSVDLQEVGYWTGIRAGDFNGDGNIDLATSISAVELGKHYEVSFVEGKGDGSFESPVPINGSENRGFLLGSGDIDGNGAMDLVVQRTTGKDLQIHLGGADFVSRLPITLPVTFRVGWVGLVDLDGDGWIDLVGEGIQEKLVFPGKGNGTFLPGRSFPVPPARWIEDMVKDLDGDGFLDTVAADCPRIIVQLGRGKFTFVKGQTIEAGRCLVPISLEDLNGDGNPDILCQGDVGWILYVLPGLGGGQFGLPQPLMPARPFLFLDVNGDGLRDVLSSEAVSGFAAPLQAILASRDGFLAGTRTYTMSIPAYHIAAGDLDGDGDNELAMGGGSVDPILILDNDRRNLEIAARIQTAGPDSQDLLKGLAVADVDEDGMKDVAFLSGDLVHGDVSWCRGQGGLAFAAHVSLVEALPARDFRFEDIDGDGIQDIFLAGFSVARGQGGGHFATLRSWRSDDDLLPSATGDFDGDGITDVAHLLGRKALLMISRGDGKGGFEAAEFLPSGGRFRGGLAIGDFNGDWWGDIAVGGVEDIGTLYPARIWYGREEGGFRQGPDLSALDGPQGGTTPVAAVDLDGDGFDDLLAVGPSYVVAYMGGSGGLGGAGPTTGIPGQADYTLVGNFAGDLAEDLVVSGEGGISLVIGERIGQRPFRRGDPNSDGAINITDAILLFNWIFLGGQTPLCKDSGDINDDGRLTISDAVGVLEFCFRGTVIPASPFPDCGDDPSADLLGCYAYEPCNP